MYMTTGTQVHAGPRCMTTGTQVHAGPRCMTRCMYRCATQGEGKRDALWEM